MNFTTNIISIEKIRQNINDIPKQSGVYKHYISTEGLDYLDMDANEKAFADDGTEVFLLYIGKAKKLSERYKWHLGFINTSENSIKGKWLSTLRLSYMANHKNIICLSEQSLLDDFMDKYTYSQYLVTDDFNRIEQELIRNSSAPLNIKDNKHKFVETNIQRRLDLVNKYFDSIDIKETATSSKKITDMQVNIYKKLAVKCGIKNKTGFLKWLRSKVSISQDRAFKAWTTAV
jgi:hypothetical protein